MRNNFADFNILRLRLSWEKTSTVRMLMNSIILPFEIKKHIIGQPIWEIMCNFAQLMREMS